MGQRFPNIWGAGRLTLYFSPLAPNLQLLAFSVRLNLKSISMDRRGKFLSSNEHEKGCH